METDTDVVVTAGSTTVVSSSQQTLYRKVLCSCQPTNQFSNVSTPENNIQALRYNKEFSSKKKRVLYNPFNGNLKEKLQNHTCSPTVFSIVVSPNQDSNEFKWTIDDLSKINPVPIEEEFIYEDKLDEETEAEIQKTIEKYFKATHLVISPWNCKHPSSWKNLPQIYKKESGCSTRDDEHNTTVESPLSPSSDSFHYSATQHCSTQTSLTLPPDLPEEIDNALKPYFLQMRIDDEEENWNVSSFPRKLFFRSEEELLSPVKLLSEEQLSPVISGCIITSAKNGCYPSTPVLECRTMGTPLNDLSPIDLSPIKRSLSNKSEDQSVAVSIMQVDTSSIHDDRKMSIDESNIEKRYTVFKECSKIFDSPKGIHRSRKRRKVCRDEKIVSDILYKMDVDATNIATLESQDTGYHTDYTKSVCSNWQAFKNSNRSDESISKYKMSVSTKSNEEDKENYLAASTPTKKITREFYQYY